MHADLVHPPRPLVRGVVVIAHARMMAGIVFGQVAGLLGFGLVVAGDQAKAVAAIVRGVEPLAAEAVALGVGMVAIAVDLLATEEIVLRPVAGLDALGQLHFAGVEAAVAHARLVVVATGAGVDVDVAGDVVQAVAWVAGATHHFDAVDVHGEHRVDEGHVAVVGVAGDAIDQQLHGVHFAFAIEAAKRQLTRGGALVELGQHHPWRAAEQLPTVDHGRFFKDIPPQDVHRAEHAAGGQRAAFGAGYGDRTEGEGGVFSRQCFGHGQCQGAEAEQSEHGQGSTCGTTERRHGKFPG